MVKRTTIELDEELLSRAKQALGQPTTRATVEEALRRAVAAEEAALAERTRRQIETLANLGDHLDLDVLKSDEMWR